MLRCDWLVGAGEPPKSEPDLYWDNPDLYWDNNVGGMAVLLRAVRAGGISMFVFSSSATVYGSQERVPISESASLAPLNPYACTKLAGELSPILGDGRAGQAAAISG
jgi:UDP-glucose 4-epimerase